MRLIDADELLFRCNCLNHVAEFAIKRAPTVDAKPVIHAKWNLADDGDGVVCSNCGEDFCTIVHETERFMYCPHCGAKMDM